MFKVVVVSNEAYVIRLELEKDKDEYSVKNKYKNKYNRKDSVQIYNI